MLLAFFFLVIVVYATYRFFLTPSTTPQAVKRLIPAFIVFGLLFVLVAMFSLSEWMVALSPRNLSAITTRAELEGIAPSTDNEKSVRVLLIGVLPPDTLTDDIEAFSLADGTINIMQSKHFVMIAPAPAPSAVLLGYVTPDGVEASVIYVGSQEAYFAFLDRFAIIPILTTVLSIIGALITWIAPLLYARKLNQSPIKK
ncbi:MAG: hypothetical protein MUE54_00590 [Anaerolineae bacterium]|nr:hypothetical protein [Anaerolineae bacterium]